MGLQDFVEEIQVLGRDLVDRVRSLIHEGNVQRIIIKMSTAIHFWKFQSV
ncbi:MAG: DUF4342 domain-containing protein [Bryobacteraceae bacterium]